MRNKAMGLVALTLLAASHRAHPADISEFEIYGQYRIHRVVDGDTVYLVDPSIRRATDTDAAKFRLVYIDTPESCHVNRKRNTPEGTVATEYLRQYEGDIITLLYDRSDEVKSGNCGRGLALLETEDGRILNIEIVRKGLSPYITRHGHSPEYDKKFRRAQSIARSRNRGFWRDGDFDVAGYETILARLLD